MSSVFVDKVYEEMDWITKAIAPIIHPLETILQELPDSSEINYSIISQLLDGRYSNSLSLEELIAFISKRNLSYRHKEIISACFKLEFVGEPVIDYNKKTISGGTISLIKISNTLDQKRLGEILGIDGIEELSYIELEQSHFHRLNEVLSLLEVEKETIKSRSLRSKKRALYYSVRDLMLKNKWNIKSGDLANKVVVWIKEYIVQNNASAFFNLNKLKVMTHSGNPIYSIEEV